MAVSPNDEKPSWNRLLKLRYTQRALGRGVRKIEKNTIRHAKKFVSSRLDRLSIIRRSVFGWIILVMVLAGVSVAQWMNFSQAYTTDSPASGGTYSEGVLGPLETLNPIFARSNAEKSASRLLFASLYRYDETGNIKGDVAKSVSINDDETEYTVTLHDGVTWSDGAPLTAEDVEFTVNLLKDPDTRAEISGWAAFGVEATDARTVVFKLPGAYAPFMHTLTFPILPQHALAGVKPSELREQSFSQSPVTSGPFALRLMQTVSTDGSKKIAHLVSNDRYFHGKPRLERFQLYAYSTKDDIERALKTNEIIATPELTYDSIAEDVRRMYEVADYSINDGVYALFNTKSKILKDRSVREALSLSVDREKLVEGLARPSSRLDGPVLPSQVGDLPSAPKRNVDKAKQLLDKAGWKVKEGVRAKGDQEFVVTMVALKGSDFSQVTEDLAKVWREELDIRIEVQIVDPLDPSQSVLQAILQPRNYDILVYELVLGGDPDVYAYWHSSQANPDGLNFANYNNAIADDALSSGRTRTDSKLRNARYESFVKRWHADVPALALFQPRINYIYSPSVTSLDENTNLVFPESRYINVIYWSVNKETVYKTP